MRTVLKVVFIKMWFFNLIATVMISLNWIIAFSLKTKPYVAITATIIIVTIGIFFNKERLKIEKDL